MDLCLFLCLTTTPVCFVVRSLLKAYCDDTDQDGVGGLRSVGANSSMDTDASIGVIKRWGRKGSFCPLF